MATNIPAGIFRGLGGGQLLQQLFLWQVAAQVMGTVLTPEMQGLQEEIWKLNPSLQLSIADAVESVVKGHLAEPEGRAEARLSGIDDKRFKTLLANAGDPPGLQALMELWRRDVIPESGLGADSVSLEQGIRESRLKDKWIAPIKSLRASLPGTAEVLDAWLKGQIEEPEARRRYLEAGGLADWFITGYNAAGTAPTPLEAAEMARRGIIPWEGRGQGVISFEQAFLEGPWRNKWQDSFKAVSQYIPPPRATTAMLRNGSITPEQAAKFYHYAGADAEVTAALLADAHHQRTAAAKELTKAEIVALYEQQAIDRPTATERLTARGYSAEDATVELDLADMKVDRALLNHAIGRIGALYSARRLDRPAATSALDALKVPAKQRDRLLEVWTLERHDNIKHLTPVDLGHAVTNSWLTVDQGLEELAKLGYGPRDAWIVLSIHLKAPATDSMPQDNLPPP